ncbi:uncharacterized protein LOC134186227 [Corticium candelabrum]|uniref:uncharacterized protein LOC134186227 n=1 Tax=Corticium candelabrum TaxID=121492 RepID=UPI002E260386|nr:uncharacterized protein LOC134186227 [Corticium candelabrum]XP_062510135.1 uncharacterized protein LOC134186227 [Corticium candelabrum]
MEKSTKALSLLEEALDPAVLETLKKGAQRLAEFVTKATNVIGEAKSSLRKAKTSHKVCWASMDSAIDLAQDFTYAVKKYAEWGTSSGSLVQGAMLAVAGDFRHFEAFMDTLTTQLRQVQRSYDSFREATQKAEKQACTAADSAEKESKKAKNHRKVVQGVGGTASGLLIGGGIAGLVLTAVFPPAGLLVGAALAGSGAAASGGVATALVTDIAATDLRITAQQLHKLGQALKELSQVGASLLAKMSRLMIRVNQRERTVTVLRTAASHARIGAPDFFIEATRRFCAESRTLRFGAWEAGYGLTRLKDMNPYTSRRSRKY